jgi:hypothetical protein
VNPANLAKPNVPALPRWLGRRAFLSIVADRTESCTPPAERMSPTGRCCRKREKGRQVHQIFSTTGACRARRCEGPRRITRRRPQSFVHVRQSLAEVAAGKQPSFARLESWSIFDFFDSIGQKPTALLWLVGPLIPRADVCDRAIRLSFVDRLPQLCLAQRAGRGWPLPLL